MEYTYQKNNTSRKFLLLIILALIISFLAMKVSTETFSLITYNNHATEKHGNEAELVRKCLNDFGGIHKFFNPNTNRYAEICFMEAGKFGIQITEDENEITSFIKNKMSTLKQVLYYLENTGYTNQIY